MKISVFIFLMFIPVIILPNGAKAAVCDQYSGDSWIYSGVTSSIKANVLILIDTSGSMGNSGGTVIGGSYDPLKVYADSKKCGSDGDESCLTNTVYYLKDGDPRATNKTPSDFPTSCGGVNPQNLLLTLGLFAGNINSTTYSCESTASTRTYQIGNYINYLNSNTSSTMLTKIEIARNVVKDLIASTTGVNFGVMTFRSDSKGSNFFKCDISKADCSGTSSSVYTTTIPTYPADMDTIFTGTTTNRQALIASINPYTVVDDSTTPLAESLYEAGLYFGGSASVYGNTVGLTTSTPKKYTSPIIASCQKNYIVVVTDGMPNGSNASISYCKKDDTSCLALVAKHLYDDDLLADNPALPHTLDKQNISTFTVGFNAGVDANALLDLTADVNHGNGKSFLATNQFDLAASLNQIMSSILSVDISFVAPVVPISPDNRTYNAKRIYMGFFKPRAMDSWEGNLKKFGLDSNNNITDKNGDFATNIDGSFKSNSISFWNSIEDAGIVAKGGVGEILKARSADRNIYTYSGTSNKLLTHADNLFTTGNTINITPALLGVPTKADVDKLIQFIHGFDSYDAKPTVKREWILGDILHSKPLIVNYKTYDTDIAANESDANTNKSIIYVGSNDGMLHAFNDYDGSEAWAFIPPAVLKDLKEIPSTMHTYSVDSSPVTYIYDRNKDGNIVSGDGDKVILIAGLRRGSGKNTAPTSGSYYALDVTNPAAPTFLWEFSNQTTGFTELGETWSEPKIVKLKIGNVIKEALFIGAGYDNMNEDSRYGATTKFISPALVNLTISGNGNLISTPDTAVTTPTSPKGRGVYAVEIATLNAGVPTIATTLTKIWGAENSASCPTSLVANAATAAVSMDYSIASDITTLDVDGNGLVDRLYATDLGGNLWRFDVGNTDVTKWTGCKIFSANPGSPEGVANTGDTGRKFFYKPVATLENSITSPTRGNDAMVLMGSGDREHPLNTSTVDRAYAVRDKGQITAKTESDLLDVTTDQLQVSTTANTSADKINNPTVGSVDYYLKQLSTNYGYFIRLEPNVGEKILAPPALSNKIAYFTSFTPGTSAVVDPCKPSNLGTSRLYVIDYSTGEAVMNYDTANDTVTTNKRSQKNGKTLVRSDRVKTIGSGIASGVVLVGDKAFIGAGGNITTESIKKGGRIINLYWGQK